MYFFFLWENSFWAAYLEKILMRTEVKIFFPFALFSHWCNLEKNAHSYVQWHPVSGEKNSNWISKEKLYHAHYYQLPLESVAATEFFTEKCETFFKDKTMWNYDLVKYTLDFLTRDWICMRIFFAATKATFYFHFTTYKRYIIGNSTKGSALSYSMESQLEMNYGRFIFSIMFFTLIHSKMYVERVKSSGGFLSLAQFYVFDSWLSAWGEKIEHE